MPLFAPRARIACSAPAGSVPGLAALWLAALGLGACQAGTMTALQAERIGGTGTTGTQASDETGSGQDAAGIAAAGNDTAGTAGTIAPAGSGSSSGSTSPPAGSTTVPAPANVGIKQNLGNWVQEVWPPGQFNNEQQAYTDGGKNVQFAADGTATITARKDGNGAWTSARLRGDQVGTLPAYYEATLTCPTGAGSWPAFWLTGTGSWPQGGEIDVMEQVNGAMENNVSGHWGPYTGVDTLNDHQVIPNVRVDQPHRYGVFIDSVGVQFYMDGKVAGRRVNFPAASNFASIAVKMVPVVNIAMGGNWPGAVPSSTGAQTLIVHQVVRGTATPAQ